MDFDGMLEELGEMGRYQTYTYVLVCLPVLFAGANSLSYVFTAGIPEYRCTVPECDSSGGTSGPVYEQPWLHLALPPAPDSGGTHFVPDHCLRYNSTQRYNSSYAGNATCVSASFNRKQRVRCDSWVFAQHDRTIVNDWGIVCLENQWKLSMVGSVHFAGIIAGTALFGVLADKLGRKHVFISCCVVMGLSGALQAASPTYLAFLFLLFLNSVATAGVYPLAFILGVEMVGRRRREATAIVINYFYAIGEALLALVAYLTGDWVVTQLIVSAPCVLFFIYYWYVPESVRWLLTNNKSRKAKGIVTYAAQVNRVKLSDRLIESLSDNQQETNDTPNILPVVRELLGNMKMVCRCAIVLFLWATNAFVYYGLSLNSTSMSGSKYLNFALMCLVEIPGYTLAWASIKYLGRRKSIVFSFVLCGSTCVATAFVPLDQSTVSLTLSLIGKLGITSAFGIIFVYTAEMLPTSVRSGGVGSCSTTGRFGALVAPFIPLLGLYSHPLPMLLFGGVSLLAAALALPLPETKGIKLPETVQEAQNI